MQDKLKIEQLGLNAHIGVHEWEQRLLQRIELDICLSLKNNQAAESDNLNDTVDYSQLCKQLQKFVDNQRCQLIEALAEKIATHLLAYDQIDGVVLTLRKFGAIEKARAVSITIERSANC